MRGAHCAGACAEPGTCWAAEGLLEAGGGWEPGCLGAGVGLVCEAGGAGEVASPSRPELADWGSLKLPVQLSGWACRVTPPAAVSCLCWTHVMEMDWSPNFWIDFGPWPHLPQFLRVLKLQKAPKYIFCIDVYLCIYIYS